MGVVELVILLEELGYACAATPFLGSALAGLAIQSAGSPEQQAALARPGSRAASCGAGWERPG